MSLSISAPVGAWEDPVVVGKGGNQRQDVITVQTLLKKAAQQTANKLYDPGTVDGAIAKAPRKSGTLDALYHFQRRFLAKPDRRVDVGGSTWRELAKFESGVLSTVVNDVVGPPMLVVYNGKVVPFYKQFDTAWGDKKLGTKKMKAVGCAVTSVAMILKYYGRDIDPGTLDDYLDENGGYSGNIVDWSVALKAGEEQGKPKLTYTGKETTASKFPGILSERIANNRPTIAHLDYGNDGNSTGDHFVVIVGLSASGNWIINDPGTNQGDGASNPHQKVTILGESTRKGGLNLVGLRLFDVA